MRTRSASVLMAVLLAGCATHAPPHADDEALIAPKTVFVIPPPTADTASVTVTQSIVAHYRDQSFACDVQIQLAPGTFDLVALDTLGRRALTVHWKNGKMSADAAPSLPPIMRPADVLADMAIVYGSDQMVSDAIAKSGATLNATATTRTIAKGGHDLIAVDYGAGEGWNRSAKLRNLAFGYEIDIQSAEVAQ